MFKIAASPPTLPTARKPSWGDGPNPILDSTTIMEVEASPRIRELDAEAPGPHILEIETVVPTLEVETVEPALEIERRERAVELESQQPIHELEEINLRW